jgi:uncharacterized protein YndB with AHSA1/START domain
VSLVAAGFAIASPALAAVTASGPAGFTVTETAHLAAPPEQAFAALITPGRWWSSEHTYSGDAANMSLDPHAGGCWCERLPGGGSAEHLHVVYVVPGKTLRLRGALGPLQGMAADGVMTVTLSPVQGGAELKLSYSVWGDPAVGLPALAGPVDNVLGEQVARLKAAVETGRP